MHPTWLTAVSCIDSLAAMYCCLRTAEPQSLTWVWPGQQTAATLAGPVTACSMLLLSSCWASAAPLLLICIHMGYF